MRERGWKKAFHLIYQPPKPQGKRAFLNHLETPRMSTPQFILSQVGYLRAWNWLLSVGIFIVAWMLMQNQSTHQIWQVSALLPFVALSTVAELNRSARYRMEELEQAARFSLKTVLLARLSLLGLGNLLLLSALFPLVMEGSNSTWAETGFCILCPYCLTSLLCLMLTRRRHGSQTLYPCAALAGGVSVLCMLFHQSWLVVRERMDVTGYVCLTLLLLVWMLWEYKRYLLGEEEFVCN